MINETFYKKKVIDGKDGWLSYDGTAYTFMYPNGEDIVVILASDEYLIEEVIVQVVVMFCPNCGEKLDDETTFCSECGFDIKNNKPSTKSSNESSGNKNIVIGD